MVLSIFITCIFLLVLASRKTVAEGQGCKQVDFEAIVVGGGPAGLQAAMTLGRSLVKALVIDEEKPRNWLVPAAHDFLGLDGMDPAIFRRQQREHILKHYGESITFTQDIVTSISGSAGNFVVETASNKKYTALRILLATGMKEEVPPLLEEHYYRFVFQCPFCHGIEERNKKWAVISPPVPEMVLMMKTWTSDIVILTNGTKFGYLEDETMKARLAKASISIDEGIISGLDISKKTGALQAVVFADGRKLARDTIYMKTKISLPKFVADLNLKMSADGLSVEAFPPKYETSIKGIVAAGDLITPFHKIAFSVGSAGQAATFLVFEIVYLREQLGSSASSCLVTNVN